MNMKHGARSTISTIAVAVLLGGFSVNALGWSVSGTVKNSSGTALSGVSVTVKDSSSYSTTTDGSGNFKLETSPIAVKNTHTYKSGSFSIQVLHNELFIKSPQDGSIGLSLIDCSGRNVWTSNIAPKQGTSRVALPAKLDHGVFFLQVRNAEDVQYYSVVMGSGNLQLEPSRTAVTTASATAKAQAAGFPTLLFKKSDYNDTSFSMTSATMSNVAVVMTPTNTQVCALPSTLKWSSSGILVDIHPDGSHAIVSVKDPTIQKYNGKYLIYCTVYSTSNKTWSMQFISFTDFAQANSATPYFMDKTSGFGGYKCAPELFYFEPKKLWYLTWQQQDPAYSTTTTPDDPKSWSAPKSFGITGLPKLPIDYFPIADANNFYLFFTGDDGKVYRSKTTLANFPSGFGAPVVVKSGGTDVVFEGSSHYKVKGTTNTYLHLVEGMGSTGRVYSAWTSDGIEGTWKDYKVGSSTPFAGKNNVTFPAGSWSNDISHGELLRENPNQNQEVDPCHLQLLFQGRDPSKNPAYELLPYKLGLLTLQ